MRKAFYIALIGLISIISFRFYSALYYPALNSDNAVTVLMIHYFKLPDDLYFWGQDRLGSLIPLLGQVFFRLFKLSPLLSESVVHYLILLAGFLAFSYFIKNYFYKIIFAVIWFLPPMRLIDVTQFSFGIHYSLIAILCFLLSELEKCKSCIKHHLLLVSIVLTAVTVIWVTDMAIISVFLLIVIQLIFYFKRKPIKIKINDPVIYYAIAGVIIGYFFIHYAKSFSSNRQDYTIFGSFLEIKYSLSIFITSLKEIFLFKASEPFTSVYSYIAVILLVYLLFQAVKLRNQNETISKWVLFFLLDAFLILFFILISKWAYLNGVPRRYFTCTYISLSFAIILLFDKIVMSRSKAAIIKTLILITVLTGGIGTLYNLKYIWPKTLKPKTEIVGEFKKLGQIGIISEYWNSYITSCVEPALIKATPNEQSYVRNKQIVEEVFMQRDLYVIRDMWFDSFPDSMRQFGRMLVKDGSEFRIGDCDVCKYKIKSSIK